MFGETNFKHMKKSISIIMLGVVVAAMAHLSSINWKSTNLELGQVKVNEVKEFQFEFTNTGAEAVSIIEAKGSCGCTVVDFSKEEIQPGKTATVTASFSSSKVGVFKKSVKVKTTASDEYVNLTFSGEVVE
jgi:hypothetical protein